MFIIYFLNFNSKLLIFIEFKKILAINLTLSIFHFKISGIVFNDEQSQNIKLISITLEVSQFEISGKYFNFEHPRNILFIFVTLEVFQFEISGKEDKDLQL